MKQSDYKQLFEGKFTFTRNFSGKWWERLYYQFSPSTYGDRLMFGFLNRYLRSNGSRRILDIGCGGGHKQLLKFGEVIGCDVSVRSLQNARKIYKRVIEADATKKLPFPDASFDVVFCFEVFGHIAYEDKSAFLQEVKRVLKPGGLAFWSIETEGKNWLVWWLKFSKNYQKLWVDYQGHIGLEAPQATLHRLLQFFKLENYRAVSKDLLAADGYINLDEAIPLFTLLRRPWVRYLLNVVLAPFFFLFNSVLPLDRANDLIVVTRKL